MYKILLVFTWQWSFPETIPISISCFILFYLCIPSPNSEFDKRVGERQRKERRDGLEFNIVCSVWFDVFLDSSSWIPTISSQRPGFLHSQPIPSFHSGSSMMLPPAPLGCCLVLEKHSSCWVFISLLPGKPPMQATLCNKELITTLNI